MPIKEAWFFEKSADFRAKIYTPCHFDPQGEILIEAVYPVIFKEDFSLRSK